MEIDVVFTFVDASDVNWQKKINTYLDNKVNWKTTKQYTAYNSVNEIEFAVKSILKYAKFVRNIYIVTDNQIPVFLKDKQKAKKDFPNVFIVDHKTIFEGYHQYLPTFNARSIATMLYRIPNLSEHFLVFNDDVLLLSDVQEKDFFIDGKLVVRGVWRSLDENVLSKKIKQFYLKVFQLKKRNKASHFKAQQLAAKKLGFTKFLKTKHTPFPVKKSTLQNYFSKNKNEFENNIKYKFRDSTQFLTESLMYHLGIKNINIVLKKKYQLAYFQNYRKPFFWLKYKVNKVEKSSDKLFLCMQSLDLCPPKKLAFIKSWLQKKYN
ncbi:hypothetical protein [uncultured Polaribacter sp.]|uniref:hypothetical protein n=1 Tax=uncultured Polaribacter sp. TaxID=174711 RepID=UPI00263A37FA|nr:hypothetical protein [uncultured Polaribacter sp.]